MHVVAPTSTQSHSATQGFTLIELSIVLVIIGLIVGGVLVGQDLIRAAEVRSTLSQIEKFNTSTNTFRGKFNALPGDISSGDVTAFNFTGIASRAGTAGEGNGNGVIEGYDYGGAALALLASTGETAFFWVDLSTNSSLIEGGFSTAADAAPGAALTATGIPGFLPAAKLGRNNFINVYSVNGTNFYGISNVSQIDTTGEVTATPGLSVAQAYNMDKKVDDGIATTGSVQAKYVTASAVTAAPSANPATASHCYDSATTGYAINITGGSNVRCALQFRFQ